MDQNFPFDKETAWVSPYKVPSKNFTVEFFLIIVWHVTLCNLKDKY